MTGRVLGTLLRPRLEALIPADLMPEFALSIGYFPNLAVTLQNRLVKTEKAKDIHIVSAWYDDKGKLHLQAILRDEEQHKVIDEAINALLEDKQSLAIFAAPNAKQEEATYSLGTTILKGEETAAALQKKLVEQARKQSKPHFRQMRIASIVPTAMANDKKEAVTDEEGNPHYYFRITGRLLETAADRKQVESELVDWLTEELPRVINPDQSPIVPKLDVIARPSPVIALQDRLVQRGLDGAVFTDASYDEHGKLEITGRLHQPGDKEKQALEDAVKELLVDEGPWTIAALKPHEASKDGKPITWNDAVRECQAKLAGDDALGRRMRLDRLYFNYENAQLKLVGQGVFLTNGAAENLATALAKSVDAVIVTRGKADVSTSNIKAIKNPLPELQNLLSARADLDGALLTQARYDADGRLSLDGYLGQPEQKAALALLLNEKLAANPDLLKKMPDAKAAWSIDSLKPHASAKGEWKWPEVVRACQGELASDAVFQRTCLERAFLQYREAKAGKPLAV